MKLESFPELFNAWIPPAIERLGPDSVVRQTCLYALSGDAKRLRPFLAVATGQALNQPPETLQHIALAVEYFHTASLIADDLPCMDNDDMRRNRPSAHRKFGESNALLASYALINGAFREMALNIDLAKNLGSSAEHSVILMTTKLIGLQGTTGGQSLDLTSNNQTFSPQQALEVVVKKTGTLFELAMGLGWLMSGGDWQQCSRAQAAGRAFGIAFQLVDDLNDQTKDQRKNRFNTALAFGPTICQTWLEQQLTLFQQNLDTLSLRSPHFEDLLARLQEPLPR